MSLSALRARASPARSRYQTTRARREVGLARTRANEPARRRVTATPCYEQPLVEPQFGHLWQAPFRTISVPHSWHGGASVSCTHARSFTSTTGIAGSAES